jgi:hypothetical protein
MCLICSLLLSFHLCLLVYFDHVGLVFQQGENERTTTLLMEYQLGINNKIKLTFDGAYTFIWKRIGCSICSSLFHSKRTSAAPSSIQQRRDCQSPTTTTSQINMSDYDDTVDSFIVHSDSGSDFDAASPPPAKKVR